MREILFRAKDRRDGKWVTGSFFKSGKLDDDEICVGTATIRITYPVVSDTVGQYTGLRDKNGTKIFEGDIIQFDYVKRAIKTARMKGRVFFEEGTAAFSLEGFFIETPQFVCDMDNIEVIGNIFDNPELLEVTD